MPGTKSTADKQKGMERGRDKLAERLVRHGGMDSEKAHKVASETVRDGEKKSKPS